MSDDGTVRVSAEMVDHMKISVMVFLSVEAVLAFLATGWVWLFMDHWLALLGPAFVFTYSAAAVWLLSHQWQIFKTKIAVMN